MRCLAILAVPMALLGACRISSPPPVDLGSFGPAESRSAGPPGANPSMKGWLDQLLKQPELSLDDYLAVVDRLSPQLEVERRNVDLAVAEAWEARIYPNPSAFAGIEDYPASGGGISRSKRTLGVAIPVVVSGRLGIAGTLVDRERELAALGYIWRRREILSAARRAFLRHLAAKQEAGLARATRDIAKTLNDVTMERFKAQAIPEMEALKSAVNLATAEADVRSSEALVAISVKQLTALTGTIDLPLDRFSGELISRYKVPGLDDLRVHVTGSHPLTEAVLKTKEVARLKVDLARAHAVPDFGFQVAAGTGSEGDTILDAGIEIPLPLFNRNQAAVAAAEIRLRQAELHLESVRTDLLLRLMEAYRTFTGAQDRVRVYEEDILPKAEKALVQTNEGYRLGKFGYLDVLDAQRTLAESKKSATTARADLNLAASDLETLTGLRLESRN